MSEETPVQAPTDIAGVGIHLSYIRRDMKIMTDKLDVITSNYVPISVHLALRAEIDKRIDILDGKVEALVLFNNAFTAKLWGISAATGVFVGLATWIINRLI